MRADVLVGQRQVLVENGPAATLLGQVELELVTRLLRGREGCGGFQGEVTQRIVQLAISHTRRFAATRPGPPAVAASLVL